MNMGYMILKSPGSIIKVIETPKGFHVLYNFENGGTRSTFIPTFNKLFEVTESLVNNAGYSVAEEKLELVV